MLLILLLERTPISSLGLVLAVVLTSAVAALVPLDSVQTLADIATIPRSLPTPVLPDLSMVPSLLVPALSLALVGLVQGAGISNSIPNPDGRYPDASGDFRGQGIANVASGLLQGMPVGGAMSATSLVRTAGARTRLANVLASVVMALLVLLFGGLLAYVAMPALAGLLILVGARTFKLDNIVMVWRTGPVQATTMSTTFVLTLLIPLQYAVLVGVGLAVILYVAQQSNRVTLVRWTFTDRGPLESEVPREVPGGEVVVLQRYGSLFFAAAPVFESQLPQVTPASRHAAVVLRLRGKQEVGSTFLTVIARYADALREVESRLYLTGVSANVESQLQATGLSDRLGKDAVFRATPIATESVVAASRAAESWVAARSG